jgi:hypothetical protein
MDAMGKGRLRRPVLAAALVSLVLAAASCKGSGGGTSAPPPPTGVALAQGAEYDQVVATWTPPSGTIDGYEAQGRLGASGAWQDLGVAIPAGAIGGVLQLQPTVPELETISFRIRAVRSGTPGPWSAEASLFRGIRWPLWQPITASPQGLVLQWTSGSQVATGLRLEREVAGAWRVLATLPASASTYLDAGPFVAGAPVRYRLVATRDAQESIPSDGYGEGFPPTPVSGLTAVTEPGGVRLRWSAPPISDQAFAVCRCAIGFAVCCSGATDHPLPASTTEVLDPAPPGAYAYEVSSRFSSPGLADASAFTEALASPTGTPSLAGHLIRLPSDATGVARDSAGRYATVHGGSYSPPYTGQMTVRFTGAGSPPDRDFGTAHGWVAPFAVYDPQDHLHVLLLVPVTGDPAVALVHAWHDGTAWHEEEVVRRPFDSPLTVRFTLSAAGTLHAAWSVAGSGQVEYAGRGAGGWAVEDLVPALSPLGLPLSLAGLAVDGTGVATVLACGSGGCAVARKDAGWIVEGVPSGPYLTLDATFAGAALLGERCVGDPANPGGRIFLDERTAAGWAPEAVVEDYAQCLPIEFGGTVDARDGSRRLVFTGPIGRLHLRFREGTGGWTSVETGLQMYRPLAWFDAAGKLHLVVRASNYGAYGTDPYAVYDEP